MRANRVVLAAEGHAAHVAHGLAQVPEVHYPARRSSEHSPIVVKHLAAISNKSSILAHDKEEHVLLSELCLKVVMVDLNIADASEGLLECTPRLLAVPSVPYHYSTTLRTSDDELCAHGNKVEDAPDSLSLAMGQCCGWNMTLT